MASVLLVEDDQAIRHALAEVLAARGHVVRTSSSGLDAIQQVVDAAPDVVVLDLGLPDVDGADVLRMLRGVTSVPVLVATARADESEIVRLLDVGADDYLVKPFSAEQLEARLRAVLRRIGGSGEQSTVVVGGIEIDIAARRVTLDSKPVELTRKEFDLLAHLARRVGEVVARDELLAEVWRQPFGGSDKTLDVHLSWLRRKLGESASAPRYLHTARGVGVRLVDPTT
jgi:DNA-binding response OmpR family regulator